ncbi:MAG: HVO_0476 family zinc finger protein [Candidatus Thermoplasmatota archaeon]
MDAPHALVVECPQCQEETRHRLLKGRMFKGKGLRLEATARCGRCGHVHTLTLTEEAPIAVPTIVSWKGGSEKKVLEFMPGEEISIGDEVEWHFPLIVTAIESEGRRVQSARASAISTLWTKRFDRVEVRFSISKGPKTISAIMDAVPDEEFDVGSVVQVKGMQVAIHQIMTQRGLLRDGTVRAREIVRVYGRMVRERRFRG